MTKAELIAALATLPDDAPVFIDGDRNGTYSTLDIIRVQFYSMDVPGDAFGLLIPAETEASAARDDDRTITTWEG